MKVYTRTGDGGQTGLIGGKRVDKHHVRVAAYGAVDELNAAIGWAQVPCGIPEWSEELGRFQEDLFIVGAELATDDHATPPTSLAPEAVERLERRLDETWAQVPPLRNFVLPGGTELAARLHIARTVCRRAERAVVELVRGHTVGPAVVPYLNRLGDLLFAYARLANRWGNVEEREWLPPEKRA